MASAEWKHLGISCVSIWNWKQKVRGPILDQKKVWRGSAELCLRVCFTTLRKDDASSKEKVKQNLISPQVMLWVCIYTVTSLRAGTCREPSSVVTHYLPSTEAIGMHDSSVHGSVPCSSWEITSGLETWSPAQREKKESVCNKEKALDQNVISPLCF